MICFLSGTPALPGSGKKVDVDAVPQIGGQSLTDFDLESAMDKPWRMPGMCVYIIK